VFEANGQVQVQQLRVMNSGAPRVAIFQVVCAIHEGDGGDMSSHVHGGAI
jgi:hypothetical protein